MISRNVLVLATGLVTSCVTLAIALTVQHAMPSRRVYLPAIDAFIHDFVNTKYDAIRTGDVTSYATYYPSDFWPIDDQVLNNDDPSAIVRLHEAMVENDSIPDEIEATIRLFGVRTLGNSIIVDYRESFEFSDTASNPTTLPSYGTNDRSITLERHGESFVIVELANWDASQYSDSNGINYNL